MEAVTLDLRAHRLDSLVLMHFFVTFFATPNFLIESEKCHRLTVLYHHMCDAGFILVTSATACMLVTAAELNAAKCLLFQ